MIVSWLIFWAILLSERVLGVFIFKVLVLIFPRKNLVISCSKLLHLWWMKNEMKSNFTEGVKLLNAIFYQIQSFYGVIFVIFVTLNNFFGQVYRHRENQLYSRALELEETITQQNKMLTKGRGKSDVSKFWNVMKLIRQGRRVIFLQHFIAPTLVRMPPCKLELASVAIKRFVDLKSNFSLFPRWSHNFS